MSKTVDELCDVFGQASGAEYERWLYDQRNDHVALAAGPALAMRRAGIAAVIRALRDEIIPERMRLTRANDTCTRSSLRRYFNEILGDAGERVADTVAQVVEPRLREVTGASPVRTATDAAPAVCVWKVYSDGLVQPSCRPEFKDEGATRHRTTCPSCKLAIKFTEALTKGGMIAAAGDGT